MAPGNITESNISLFIYFIHFCLIWKSNGITFDQAIEEVKLNFGVVDNVISDNHVKSSVKFEYEPIKVQSPLTDIVVYDLEIQQKMRVVPYFSCV